jgi:hypothetical protein
MAVVTVTSDGFWGSIQFIEIREESGNAQMYSSVYQYAMSIQRPPLALIFDYWVRLSALQVAEIFTLPWSFFLWISCSLIIAFMLLWFNAVFCLILKWNLNKAKNFFLVALIFSSLIVSNASYFHDPTAVFFVYNWFFVVLPFFALMHLFVYQSKRNILHLYISSTLLIISTNAYENTYLSSFLVSVGILYFSFKTKASARHQIVIILLASLNLWSILHWLGNIAKDSAQPGYEGADFQFSLSTAIQTLLTQFVTSTPLGGNFRAYVEHLRAPQQFYPVPFDFPPNILTMVLLIIVLGIFLAYRTRLFQVLKMKFPSHQNFTTSQFILAVLIGCLPMAPYAASKKYTVQIPEIFTFYLAYGSFVFVLLFFALLWVMRVGFSKNTLTLLVLLGLTQVFFNHSTASLTNKKNETLIQVSSYLSGQREPNSELCEQISEIKKLNYAGNGVSTANMIFEIFQRRDRGFSCPGQFGSQLISTGSNF